MTRPLPKTTLFSLVTRPIVRILVPAAILLSALLVAGRFRSRETAFLSLDERHWLREYGDSIVLAEDPRWRPDQAVEEQRIYEGLTADFTTLIEHKLGVRFKRLRARFWVDVLDAEMRGRVDIHPVLVRTAERDRNWLFTDPYIKIPVVVVMRASLKNSFSPEKMKTMRMGVGYGYGIAEFVSQKCKDYNIVPIESDRFGLIKTSLGEVDLMITDLASASHYIEKEGLTNLRLAATMGSLYEFSFASRRDKPILHEILKKALKQITRKEREEIYDRWIAFGTTPFYKSRQFWYSAAAAGAAVLLLLVAILTWNMALKRQVFLTTLDLRRELLERKRAEKALTEAHAGLEKRVEERTVELAQANAALQNEIHERARMANDILGISSGERARIGRDLHDSIGQQLVGVTLWSKTLEEHLEEESSQQAELARKISREIESVIAQTRFIVGGLLPVDILEHGLVAALDRLAKDTAKMFDLDCAFTCEDEESCRIADNALSTNIYRVAQEAVGNACKHGKAGRINISLDVKNGQGKLVVSDDGLGIPKDQANRGMGLKIMRYRAEIASGGLFVTSSPEKGTKVVCQFQASPQLDFHGPEL